VKAAIDGPNLPKTDFKGQAVEIFTQDHFVTVTGEVLPGYEILQNRQDAAEALYFKLQAARGRAEQKPEPARVKDPLPDDYRERAARYCERALELEAFEVSREPEGNRNNRLNEASLKIGHYVGAGHLGKADVRRVLLRAALSSGLDESEARATIESGLKAGMAEPKDPELNESSPEVARELEPATTEPAPEDPEIEAKARAILQSGDPVGACLEYVTGKIYGAEKQARAIILAGYSAYLLADDRLYADAVGSPQSGKSATSVTVLETFPPENVIVASEASPKSLYYLAAKSPERLKDAIVYIDDSRPEHIPVLKTFRNEGNVTPRNLTVSDGKVLELVVKYRPAVLASSVNPLRDQEDQATSRTFLVTFPAISAEEERAVRSAIRQRSRAGAILSQQEDGQIEVLRAMARALRDEGIRDVLIPFDAEEPEWADRRGTGQFQRMIKVSAFINQFQRPILELNDGRRFVLAVYEDLVLAARVWFDFAEGQRFKISPKAGEVLHALPSSWPGTTAPNLAKEMEKGQRTIERYLNDLFEAGIVSRERIQAPGMPWGYWSESRQKAMSQISATGDFVPNSDRIATKNLCRKYMAKKSPDSLKDSISSFFSNNDIINKEMYKAINNLAGVNPEEIYLSHFSPKFCRDSERSLNNGSLANQTNKRPHICDKAILSLFDEKEENSPTDSDELRQEKIGGNGMEFVANPTLAGELAEADQREAEDEARKRTPHPANSDGGAAAFKQAHVALTFEARSLKRFSASTLAGESGKTPVDALQFLEQARALGLAEKELDNVFWVWLETARAATE